jgi:hypothetical protein
MRKRVLTLIGLAVVIAGVSLVSVAAQAPTASAQKGPAPKTAWGVPDLTGIWDTTPFQVPLQRPAKYKDQQVFTEEQRAELDKVRAAMPGNETRSVRGTEVDVAGAYNVVYTSRRPTGTRTSLITDPPDGRIPPLTPEVQKRNRQTRARTSGPAAMAGSTTQSRRRDETNRVHSTQRRTCLAEVAG